MPVVCEFDTQTIRPSANPKSDTRALVCFPRPFIACPRLPHGIRALDVGNNANIRVKTITSHLTNTWAEFHVQAWHDTKLYHAINHIFVLAPADVDFLTGEYMRKSNGNNPSSTRINFERPFVTPPHVVVFFNYLDLGKERHWRIHVSASAIDAKGFTLSIDTLGDTIFHAAQAGWIAYPEDREHIFSTSIHTLSPGSITQPQLQWSKYVLFSGVSFWDKPSVFVALSLIDVDCKANLRLNAYVDGISKTGLVCHIDTSDDTVVYAAGASIIAFN